MTNSRGSRLAWMLIIVGIVFLSACQRPTRTETSPTHAITVETSTPPSSPTLPEPTYSPPPTFTPTAHVVYPILPPLPGDEIPAQVRVEMLNLRSGPSTLYTVVNSYPEDTQVIVRGKALGDEWVLVNTDDTNSGWMLAIYLDLPVAIENIPLVTDFEALTVYGKVVDTAGYSIDGINLALTSPTLDDETRTDAYSNIHGDFFFYLPLGSSDLWQVSIVGIQCESIVMDEDCRLRSFFERQVAHIVRLPLTGPVIFVYERASTLIRGTVINDQEQPVEGMRVYAVRADDARSWGSTNEFGEFELPASDGRWEIFAVQFNPRVEGERVTIEIVSGSAPEALFIQAPSTQAEG